VGRHRSVAVGQDLAVHRDQVAALGQLAEVLTAGEHRGHIDKQHSMPYLPSMAHDALHAVDPEIADLILAEERRERDCVRLIPSGNYVSHAVLSATGSVLTNKYSEGYPGKRYYEGQKFVDQIENLAIARAKSLFGAEHANVQPYSGSPCNLAVYLAFMKPG